MQNLSLHFEKYIRSERLKYIFCS